MAARPAAQLTELSIQLPNARLFPPARSAAEAVTCARAGSISRVYRFLKEPPGDAIRGIIQARGLRNRALLLNPRSPARRRTRRIPYDEGHRNGCRDGGCRRIRYCTGGGPPRALRARSGRVVWRTGFRGGGGWSRVVSMARLLFESWRSTTPSAARFSLVLLGGSLVGTRSGGKSWLFELTDSM